MFSGTLVERLVAGQPLDVLIAGDDEEAEETVARLVRERVRAAGIGFEEAEGGSFVVRDPWRIAARFVTRDVTDGVRKREVGTDPRGFGTT